MKYPEFQDNFQECDQNKQATFGINISQNSNVVHTRGVIKSPSPEHPGLRSFSPIFTLSLYKRNHNVLCVGLVLFFSVSIAPWVASWSFVWWIETAAPEIFRTLHPLVVVALLGSSGSVRQYNFCCWVGDKTGKYPQNSIHIQYQDNRSPGIGGNISWLCGPIPVLFGIFRGRPSFYGDDGCYIYIIIRCGKGRTWNGSFLLFRPFLRLLCCDIM